MHDLEISAVSPPALWRNRDYVLLWSGQAVSTLGSGITGLAFPLLVLALTNSPAQAGLVAAVFTVPYIFVSLPAGALVDRWDRKKVMIRCDTLRALNMGAIPLAAALGYLSVAQLYIGAAIEGTAFVFFNVAEVAALPRVVDKSQIPDAASQNQAAQTGTALVSPPLGGFIFQVAGHAVPFLFDAVSYAVSVVSLLFVQTEFQLERAVAPRRLTAEIAEGVRWMWRQPLIRFMSFLSGGLNLCNQAVFLILLILAKQRGASPTVIGVIFAIAAVGGLLGSLVAPRIQRRFGYGQVIIACVWIQSVIMPLFAIAPNSVVLGALGAVIFLTGPIYVTVQFSHRISLIPDELQGRVNSAVRLIAFAGLPLGSLSSGLLIQMVGAIPAVLLFSAGTAVLAVLTTINRHVRTAAPLPETLPA